MAKLTYQQKLDALSYRFYQGGQWSPKAGDFYTTSRADLELYQVVSVENGVIRTRYTEGSDAVSEWPETGFLTEGFGPRRVYVPDWVMKAPAPPREPYAAMTVDLTGCEHLSRDIKGIEAIAAAGAKGPTEVVYLYSGPSPTPSTHSEGSQGYFQVTPASSPSGLLSQEPEPSSAGYAENATPATDVLEFPRKLTEDLRDILSMMMWNTGPIAHALRSGGADIKTRAEEEQAHVMHWLITLALEHGSAWREKASDRISEIRAVLATEGNGND